jgi:long-chain acyl-CoA synthetase
MQVEEFLEASAERFPEKVALIVDGRKLTYRDLDRQANALAHAFVKLCVRRGDRVAIALDNSVEAVLSIFATLKGGGVFVVIHPGTKLDKLIYILNNCRASCIVSSSKRCRELEAIADRVPHLKAAVVTGPQSEGSSQGLPKWMSFERCLAEGDATRPPKQNIDVDLAALIYTSASTGDSKGAMLTHLNMVSAARSITTYLENRPNDIILNALPLAFDYGLYQVLMGFKIGGTVVLDKSFAYPHTVLQKIAQEKVTGFPLVPTMAAMLLEMDLSKYDFGSLRYVTNTGAVLPTHHIKRLRTLWPHARLYSMYGLTECKRVSYLPPEQLEIRPSSVGKGMPNQEVYLVDQHGNRTGPGSTGELVVRGSHVMKGYWDLPDETNRVLKPGLLPNESVLHTGDLFRMDDEGYLYFIGRMDDMIKTSGKKVSPLEVENVLHAIEGIAEAVVIGIPDAILGQRIKAVVRVKHGVTMGEQDIIRHSVSRLEDYMVPKAVEIVKDLPRTESGKIDKTALLAKAELSSMACNKLEVA